MPTNGNGNGSKPASLEVLTRVIQKVISEKTALEAVVKSLQEKIAGFEAVVPEAERLDMRLRREAQRTVPFLYNLDITLTGGSTASVAQSIQIEQEGAFLMYKIQASWRPTTGANAGLYLPFSHDHPSAQAPTSTTDWASFVCTITEGVAQRRRNKNPIPGSLLYRNDEGLVLQEPDVFVASSNVEVTVTPLVAPTNTGILTFTLNGVQLLSARA